MSKQDLRRHLANFYQCSSLPASRAERLVGLARGNSVAEDAGMRSDAAIRRQGVLIGLAAGLVIFLTMTALLLHHQRSTFERAPDAPRSALTVAAGASGEAVTIARPRLVAAQIQAEWCKRTPVVAPIFADLTTKYGAEPILFVTLDITDEARRRQAHLLAANLGLKIVFDSPFESGMVKLIDTEGGEVLAVLYGKDEQPAMETVLAQALLQHP